MADIAGALAPSLTDVQFYRSLQESLGLQGAWITNGFDPLHLPAAAFPLLRAHPPQRQ